MPARMKTIAVVEDNIDNMLLVRIILQDLYELNEYDNGQSALSGIASAPPDLVLMDISLPDIDGVTVMQELRANKNLPAFPIFALTAHAMEGDKEKFLQAGFDFYMAKPLVDTSELLRVIAAHLDKASS